MISWISSFEGWKASPEAWTSFYGDLGDKYIAVFDKEMSKKNFSRQFFQFWVIKTLCPDWYSA